ncbi:MAG TPA: PTS fructose transporter subunit IIA [Gammaproteobacteria bacterium]|nr:PTS fructose transporter subunit IIA [Gammaproteobacteria bacterium]
MTVGVLLVTHEGLGEQMLRIAIQTLGFCPLQIETLPIDAACMVEEMDAMAAVMCQRLDEGDGVLVLTDLYGSTPCNIAFRLLSRQGVSAVSGVNMPMLIRVMNYSHLPLPELVEKALSGGRDGIVLCQQED